MRGAGAANVRIGLVGCGAIARYAHLRVLRHLRGATLVAVADPESDVREGAGRLAGVATHEHVDALLLRTDIDAVVICAPTPVHAELAIAAAAAGKHFYLEKPLGTSAEEGRRVVEAAELAEAAGGEDLMTAIGFNRRLHPLYEQARETLRAGRIGQVRAVTMTFCEPRLPESMPAWMLRRDTGGGALLDLASHHLDSLRWFLDDEPREVAASLSTELSEHDTARLALSTRGGVDVQGFFSFRAGYSDFLEFLGDQGTLRVDRFRRTLELRVRRARGYGTARARVRPNRAVATWRLERPFRRVREVSFRRSLAGFVDLVQGHPRRVASLEDGLRCLEAVLEAEASARAGQELRSLASA